MARPAWKAVREGLALDVRLTPRAALDRVEGLEQLADGRCVLKARVRAAPDKGSANAALLRLIAEWLDVPKSSVDLRAGASARLKTVVVKGEAEALAMRLERGLSDQK